MDSKLLAQFLRILFACFIGMVAIIVGLFMALLLTSCAPSKPKPVNSIGLLSGVTPDITDQNSLHKELTPLQIAQLPKPVQRQYRKNLRAQPRTVPFVQGRAAVAANGPITAPVQTSYKPAAPVVQATDSAQVQVANTKKAPAVAGNGNSVPSTTTNESWLRPLLPYAAGAAGLGLLYSLLPLGLAGSGWLWAVLRKGRSREPETG